MMTSANSSDSKLLSLYFCYLREPPYWMLVPVMVDTKLREGSMSSRFFVREQSTRIICTRHTLSYSDLCLLDFFILSLTVLKLLWCKVCVCFFFVIKAMSCMGIYQVTLCNIFVSEGQYFSIQRSLVNFGKSILNSCQCETGLNVF